MLTQSLSIPHTIPLVLSCKTLIAERRPWAEVLEVVIGIGNGGLLINGDACFAFIPTTCVTSAHD